MRWLAVLIGIGHWPGRQRYGMPVCYVVPGDSLRIHCYGLCLLNTPWTLKSDCRGEKYWVHSVLRIHGLYGIEYTIKCPYCVEDTRSIWHWVHKQSPYSVEDVVKTVFRMWSKSVRCRGFRVRVVLRIQPESVLYRKYTVHTVLGANCTRCLRHSQVHTMLRMQSCSYSVWDIGSIQCWGSIQYWRYKVYTVLRIQSGSYSVEDVVKVHTMLSIPGPFSVEDKVEVRTVLRMHVPFGIRAHSP